MMPKLGYRFSDDIMLYVIEIDRVHAFERVPFEGIVISGPSGEGQTSLLVLSEACLWLRRAKLVGEVGEELSKDRGGSPRGSTGSP